MGVVFFVLKGCFPLFFVFWQWQWQCILWIVLQRLCFVKFEAVSSLVLLFPFLCFILKLTLVSGYEGTCGRPKKGKKKKKSSF